MPYKNEKYSSTLQPVLISKVCSWHFSKILKNKLLMKIFLYLCCNACMVAARNPQHFAALHSSPNGFEHFKHYISKMKFFSACFWSHLIWHNMAVMAVMTFVSHYHRTRASSMATVRAWPRCSVPVTLGGGIHMEKVCSTAWGKASCTTTWHYEVWTFKMDNK